MLFKEFEKLKADLQGVKNLKEVDQKVISKLTLLIGVSSNLKGKCQGVMSWCQNASREIMNQQNVKTFEDFAELDTEKVKKTKEVDKFGNRCVVKKEPQRQSLSLVRKKRKTPARLTLGLITDTIENYNDLNGINEIDEKVFMSCLKETQNSRPSEEKTHIELKRKKKAKVEAGGGVVKIKKAENKKKEMQDFSSL